MQQIMFIALTLSIFALTFTEICYSIKAMRYQQTLARKHPFDAYALEFEMEVKSRLRQAYYKADMDSKYNE